MRVHWAAIVCVERGLLFLFVAVLLAGASAETGDRTWRYVRELPAADQAKLDLCTTTPRNAQLPYLPAERFPFTPPYTAEEMGLRAMEFPHSPLWNGLVLDIGTTITSTGFLQQEVSLIATLYLPEQGFPGHLYQIQPGQELFRWLSYSVMPPQPADEPPSLLIGYRTDLTFPTPAETLIFRPALLPLRSRLEREDRAPNRVGTFADALGRNAWEFSWQLLGTDVLSHTVRFPVTSGTVLVPDARGNPLSMPTSEIKLMGHDYPAYTVDGGVQCYVVEAVPQPEWLPDSSLSKLIYWLDQRAFFPLRLEQYDTVGKLTLITVQVATRANPQLGERGYAALLELSWDLARDLMTASTHRVILKDWTKEERRYFFHPVEMPREWLPPEAGNWVQFSEAAQFYLRPSLDADKFPHERTLALPPHLAARLADQERAGQLVFR